MENLDSLGRGWQVAWKNKGLWLLGVLAACTSSTSGGNGNGGSSSGNTGSAQGSAMAQELSHWAEQNTEMLIAIGVGLVLLALVWAIVAFVLNMIARGGLLKGSQIAMTQGQVSFGEAFSAGREQIGRLLSVWLITDLPFVLVGLLVGIGAIVTLGSQFLQGKVTEEAIGPLAGLLACMVPLGCLLLVGGFVARIFNHMGTLVAVFENKSGLEALQEGFAVLRENFLPFALIAIILGVLQNIIGFVLSLPLTLAVFFVIFGSVFAASGADGPTLDTLMPMLATTLVCGVLYAPVILGGLGVFHTWANATWADLYTRLRGPATPVAPAPPSTPLDYSAPSVIS